MYVVLEDLFTKCSDVRNFIKSIATASSRKLPVERETLTKAEMISLWGGLYFTEWIHCTSFCVQSQLVRFAQHNVLWYFFWQQRVFSVTGHQSTVGGNPPRPFLEQNPSAYQLERWLLCKQAQSAELICVLCAAIHFFSRSSILKCHRQTCHEAEAWRTIFKRSVYYLLSWYL